MYGDPHSAPGAQLLSPLRGHSKPGRWAALTWVPGPVGSPRHVLGAWRGCFLLRACADQKRSPSVDGPPGLPLAPRLRGPRASRLATAAPARRGRDPAASSRRHPLPQDQSCSDWRAQNPVKFNTPPPTSPAVRDPRAALPAAPAKPLVAAPPRALPATLPVSKSAWLSLRHASRIRALSPAPVPPPRVKLPSSLPIHDCTHPGPGFPASLATLPPPPFLG